MFSRFPWTFPTLVLFCFALLLFSCETEPAQEPPKEETPVAPSKLYTVPDFIEDSAYQYVARQVAFGPRVPGSQAHQACKEWLVGQLESFGWKVIEQDFVAEVYTGEKLNSTNIIGQYNPTAKKRVLLAAHWDSRHLADSPISEERQGEAILGADDGGSGVGVLLEVARQLQANPIDEKDMGVDIIFFDAEDYGESGGSETTWCLGSQYWSKNLHAPNYRPRYGILLDMVGSQSPRFTKDKVSMTFAPQVMNKVWRLAQSIGYGNLFVDIETGILIDDHYFVNQIAKIPMIDIINKPPGSQTGFGDYWHTHEDDMDVISAKTLNAVGQVVLAVLYREASGKF